MMHGDIDTIEQVEGIAAAKRLLRSEMRLRRAEVVSGAELSQQAITRSQQLAEWQQAETVLWYVSVRDEVSTHQAINEELALGKKRVVVPWCHDDDLELVELQSWAELQPGRFGILEPSAAVRQSRRRSVARSAIELCIVPGLAFDRRGRRLGLGRGFFDRLFADGADGAFKIGLAFDCQIVPRVPCESWDTQMNAVVTPTEVIKPE